MRLIDAIVFFIWGAVAVGLYVYAHSVCFGKACTFWYALP